VRGEVPRLGERRWNDAPASRCGVGGPAARQIATRLIAAAITALAPTMAPVFPGAAVEEQQVMKVAV
jgi:hypothetical protein